jgi:polysaccharide export outer membrane protein
MKKTIFCLLTLVLGFLFIGSLNSCVSTKDLAYFNNIPRDTTLKTQPQLLETVISKNDVLQITFSTLDAVTTATLNAAGALSVAGGSTPGVTGGYLVDETGIIKLPEIGALKAGGLTKRELDTLITNELLRKKLALDPIVTVRIVNYKVTVLGEVNRPGVIPVPNEKITLPEALGAAGDLTIYGKRNNVLLIRETNEGRVIKRFSLNNDQLFNKDIYNLQNQDIIYVEPNKARALSSDATTQLLPIGVSLVSLIIIIYSQFKR